MNDAPRQTLSRIIAKHGRGVCDAPKRVEALLRDLCGSHRREINIIVGALEERVAADLIRAGKSAPRDALLARLAARLRDDLAYTPEAARWGVETWAVALGVLTETELQERARDKPTNANRSSALPPAREPKPTTQDTPAGGSASAPQPQPGAAPTQRGTPHGPPPRPPLQTTTPPRQQTASASLPTTRPLPPAASRPTAPPARRTPPAYPQVVAPPRPPPHVAPVSQPEPRPRGRRLLRGCLVVSLLIIVLAVAAIFVVPAIIVLLQEEQARPSINEPRIR